MDVDDGKIFLSGYMRDYSQCPPGCHPPQVKEVNGESQFENMDKPGGWS